VKNIGLLVNILVLVSVLGILIKLSPGTGKIILEQPGRNVYIVEVSFVASTHLRAELRLFVAITMELLLKLL
jgi:hypothetical protein